MYTHLKIPRGLLHYHPHHVSAACTDIPLLIVTSYVIYYSIYHSVYHIYILYFHHDRYLYNEIANCLEIPFEIACCVHAIAKINTYIRQYPKRRIQASQKMITRRKPLPTLELTAVATFLLQENCFV